MMRFTDNPQQNAQIVARLREREEDLVKKGQELARGLGREDKARQLRNIQEVAEQSTSWAEVDLFIRYQAARKQIPANWANDALNKLKGLEDWAKSIAGTSDPGLVRRIFLYMVQRVLGYAVRWHVWYVDGEPQLQKAQQGGA